MRKFVIAACTILAGCGGGAKGPSVAAVGSSVQAAQEFMRAAKDSNLTRMAELWGTSRGSAGATHNPPDYERRVVVLQAYLHGDSARVVSDVATPGDASRRRLLVSLFRGTCTTQIAMVTILSKSGWIINQVDLTTAGNPAQPCQPGTGR